MSSWNLPCRNCKALFAESAIAEDQALLWRMFFPAKPKLPSGGSEFECPHCGHKAVYETSDYVYRA
jgi:DNA-directed RNA polymerase subunit RPC12/RpoP